jgi:hypothetical protein
MELLAFMKIADKIGCEQTSYRVGKFALARADDCSFVLVSNFPQNGK